MIKSAEIKKIVNQELGKFLVLHGYVKIKVKGDLAATFEKKDENYYYDFYCHTNKFNGYELVYGFSFGIDKITEVLKEIDQIVPLSRSKYEIRASTIGLSPGRLRDPFNPGGGYTHFTNDSELLAVIEDIKSFYRKTFYLFVRSILNSKSLTS
jgi:hypothetical protein